MNPVTIEKPKYESLIAWLKSKDAIVNDAIYIQQSSRGGGYGAFVSTDIPEGDLLFTVPRSACITLDNVKTDPQCGDVFQKIMDKAGPGGNTVVMAGFLAKEYLCSDGVGDGDFGPYLETLPWVRGINAQEHVLFWESVDVEINLKGSFCYKETMELRSEVDLAISVLNNIIGRSVRVYRGEELESGFRFPWQPAPTLGPVEGLDEAVKGAFVSLLTRGFEDGEDADKLVPLLDMLQHSDEPNVSHVMRKSDGTVEVRAKRRMTAGEELLNQYRSEEEETMPYHRFFTRFGFVPGIMEPVENLLKDQSSIFYPKVVEV